MPAALAPLGDSVRRRRREQGLTLSDLAARSGLSARFLSDLERGRGNISIARLMAVAGALEVPLSELVEPLDAAEERRIGRPTGPIALVGLRGAGKSSVGKRVAEELELGFVELDREVESAAGLPLSQIFEIHGDAYYRRLEREVLARVLEKARPRVIAAGGGVVTDGRSWSLLKRRAFTVWLEATPEDHYRRVMAQGDLRPMANRPAAMAELRAILSARRKYYAEADLRVDTSALGFEGSVAEIVRRVSAA